MILYLWPQAGGTNFSFAMKPRFGMQAQTAESILYDYYNPTRGRLWRRWRWWWSEGGLIR